jgi:hypothetical protein
MANRASQTKKVSFISDQPNLDELSRVDAVQPASDSLIEGIAFQNFMNSQLIEDSQTTTKNGGILSKTAEFLNFFYLIY